MFCIFSMIILSRHCENYYDIHIFITLSLLYDITVHLNCFIIKKTFSIKKVVYIALLVLVK